MKHADIFHAQPTSGDAMVEKYGRIHAMLSCGDIVGSGKTRELAQETYHHSIHP
jgi:hypothetical protein